MFKQSRVQDSFLDEIKLRFLRRLMIALLVAVWLIIAAELVTPNTLMPNLPLVAPVVHVMVFAVLLALQQSTTLGSYLVLAGIIMVMPLQLYIPSILLLGVAAIVVASYLLDRIGYIIFNVILFGVIIARIIPELREIDTELGVPILVGTLINVFVSIVARYFASTIQNFSRLNARNNELIRATAEVGQVVNSFLSQDELFRRAVELIRDRFAYYHVQIFLVDEERKFAHLVASTGDVGLQLLKRKHKLGVGSPSVIGRVTQVGEPIIARDTDRDPLHARNELLPNTRSELALPIVERERIIGALDVQSTRSGAFEPVDVRALQIMANQLGVAIRNAQLFDVQNESVKENKRLFFEAEANLREIRRLNRQLTQKTWRDFIESTAISTGITASGTAVNAGAEWTPVMIDAGLRRRVAIIDAERKVAVPIVLRGEVIGAIEVTLPAQPDDDRVELLESVAGRLALSLDNARLFEEAQRGTIEEQRLNEIVGNYQTAGTVDELLQITLTELTSVFNATGGQIRLGRPPAEDADSHSGDNGVNPNGGSHHHDEQ